MTIRTKLTLVLLASTIIPMFVAGAWGFSYAKNSLQQLRIVELEEISHLKANRLEDFFAEREGDAKVMQVSGTIQTNLPVLLDYADDKSGPEYIEAKRKLEARLAVFQTAYGYEDVFLVCPEGKIILTTDKSVESSHLGKPLPDPGERAFSEGKKGIYFSEVYQEGTDPELFLMLVTAPLSGIEENFTGLIAFEVDMTWIYEFVQDATGMGETGESLIARISGDGALFLNPLRHDPDAALKRNVSFGEESAIPIQEALHGQTGSGISTDYRSKRVIAAWRPIHPVNWGMVAKIDASEAFAPVANLRNVMLILGVVMILIAILMSLWLTKAMVNPIHALQMGAQIIGSGNLDHNVGTKAKDEIGQLSRDFDRMTQSLKAVTASRNDLEMEISERKRAEDELRKSEESFRLMVTEVKDYAIFSIDPEGKVATWNEGARAIKGYTPEEVIGEHFSRFYDENDIASGKPDKELEEAAEHGRIEDVGWRVRKDGSKFIANVVITAIRDETGALIGFSKVTRDVTERKQAEDELRNSETRFRSVYESGMIGTLFWNVEGKITGANDAFLEMVGYTSEEVLSGVVSWQEMTPPEYKERDDRVIEELAETGVMEPLEKEYICKDGSRIHIIIGAATLPGDELNGVAYILDISSRKQAEEQRRMMEIRMRQQQKLESIGTLAGGVAHEINNPLNGVMNYAQLISDRLEPDSPLKEYSDDIIRETERMGVIVRNLLTFARDEKHTHSPARFQDIVETTLSLIHSVLLRDQIEIEVDVPEDLPQVKCRSQQIQQVIMNLLTNARDALNEKYPDFHVDKVIKITTREIDKDGKKWLRTTVEDHGTGIPGDVQDRLFDPFFTTKPKEKGTGLGLSISHGIASDHGGELTVESEPGSYTRFHLDLSLDNGWSLESTEETAE